MADMHAIEEGTAALLDFNRLAKLGERGLAVMPVVLQNHDTGEVLYVAYVTESSVRESLQLGRVVLWSTSRNERWEKGATSGDYLSLVEARVNCEQNSLLFRVRPVKKGACHTKDASGQTRVSCYYRKVTLDGETLKLEHVSDA